MYYDMNIPLGSYRDFDEVVQVHDRVYSEDPEIVHLGCEQIFAWLSKYPKPQPFFEITALLASNLVKNSKDPLDERNYNQFVQNIKYLINKIISEFPTDYEYYQYLTQYAFSDDYYIPPKEELFSLAPSLLAYLNENFWIPNIKIYQKHIEDANKHISEYFENEDKIEMSKTNFLFYFVPVLAKEFCKDYKGGKVDDKELIFGFTRSELISKFPKFINNAIEFTDQIFTDSFAFEFSDYLIQGSTWASKVLDMLFENKLCDTKIISNYILCAPNKNQIITDFLKKHGIETEEENDNFWSGIPMGALHYQYDDIGMFDLHPNLEVNSSLVGILHEEKRYYNSNRNNQRNYSNNRNFNPKNSTPESNFNPSKIHTNQRPPPPTQNNANNNKSTNTANTKPATSFNPIKVQVNKPPKNDQDNTSNSFDKPKPIIITGRSKDKKLDISKPNDKK